MPDLRNTTASLPADAMPAAAGTSGADVQLLAPRTILVVDDEPALLRLMAFVLQKQGHIMLTATNGDEALDMVRQQRPDLIVLDIMMPKRDGYQVAQAIRADADLASIPIVMLSAKAQDEDIARGMEAGVDTFITKPFDPQELADTVAAFLRQHPAVAAAISSPTPTTE